MKKLALLVCMLMLILYGCGSSSSSNEPKTGHAVGSIIDHLPYKCGAYTGKTGRLGNFTYMPDQGCTFSLGKMSFTVTPNNLYKGYVTVYDLVPTKDEAWTLMAIIQSISYIRPIPQELKGLIPDDFVLIIDGNLERRIPAVDLKKGDAAVADALKTFAGTVNAVKVADARQKLSRTVKEDNTLTLSREEIITKGRQILDALHISDESGKPFVPKNGQKMTYHDNRVNLRFYDYLGNPLAIDQNGFSISGVYSPFPNAQWLWVTSGQNPGGYSPVIGANQADISGYNIMGIDLHVGRSASSDVGSAFYNAALSTRGYMQQTVMPMTVYGYGAHPSLMQNTSFPQQLNLGYNISMYGYGPSSTTTRTDFSCDSLMLGQGSTKASWSKIVDFFKELGETTLSAFEAFGEEGENIKADVEFLVDATKLVDSAIDLATSNWWVLSSDSSVPQWRINYRGYASTMRQCISGGIPMPMIFYSTYDDHTFDVVVVFPGQSIQGILINNPL